MHLITSRRRKETKSTGRIRTVQKIAGGILHCYYVEEKEESDLRRMNRFP